MSNNTISADSWTIEADDADLLQAVEKFLDIQGANFAYPRRKNLPVSDEAVNIYHEWVSYWYRLRKGAKLSLSEVRSICGYECTVQILDGANDRRKYLIQFNPDFTVAGHE